ncbi:protein of unknown function [Streptococcus thermophilus]|nr:protein of unknown function [Streptococcus thermophilus]
MIQAIYGIGLKEPRFSRTRGGDPKVHIDDGEASKVFPAHAGVILREGLARWQIKRFSRTRGGDPGTLSS